MQEAYKALAKAQQEMGKALKKATNPHFRKQYADLGNVQEACLDAFHANGFAVFQPTGHDDLGMFVKTVLAHDTGETLECRTPLIVDKNNMQGLGSAITYARRYGLLCMSGVAPEDDDGNASVDQSRAAELAVQITNANVWLEESANVAEVDSRAEKLRMVKFGGTLPSEVQKTRDAMKQKLTEEQEAA